jgi:TusA-related sulfurtransferase
VTAARVLDCLGRPCPVPVIELARALPSVEVGEVLEVLSDDPAARHDLPAWCRMRGQEWLGEQARPVGAAYRVRRTS